MIIPDNEEEFQKLYSHFAPKGSGPLQLLRVIQVLMREIASLRGYKELKDV